MSKQVTSSECSEFKLCSDEMLEIKIPLCLYQIFISVDLFKVICWALIFIKRIRSPPGTSIAIVLTQSHSRVH